MRVKIFHPVGEVQKSDKENSQVSGQKLEISGWKGKSTSFDVGKWLLGRVGAPFLLGVLENLALILPPALIKKFAFFLGDMFYRFSDLQLAKTQWKQIMKENDDLEVSRHIRRVSRHFALSIMELMLLKKKGERILEDLVVEVEGEEFLREALSRNRGVVLVTAHLGNWEILGAWLGSHGYPVTALVNPISIPVVQRFMEELRLTMKVELIERTNLLSARSVLRQGKILGVLTDLRIPGGVVCDFLGREAPSPATPAVFHLLLGSPIIPAFTVREGEEMKHRIVFLPPLDWPLASSREENILRGTAYCNQVVGEFILRYPDQWNWFYKRWSD